VFGEGRRGGLMLVGEQPGDVEDRRGRPFVGPAGTQRRIHDKPNAAEIRACNHWLELELVAVAPELVLCLGATAAQALFGRSARVGALRGRPHAISPGLPALVTIHPSAVLRAGDARAERRAELLEDLLLAATLLGQGVPAVRS
jgi:DNA polymerase